eukprot:384773-Alexandrium_andersonii.AAC.1
MKRLEGQEERRRASARATRHRPMPSRRSVLVASAQPSAHRQALKCAAGLRTAQRAPPSAPHPRTRE